MRSRRSIAILLFSTVCVVALFAHLPLLNGPYYWKWQWRRLPAARVCLFLSAAIPLGIAVWISTTRLLVAITLLMIATMQLRVGVALAADPHLGFDWLNAVVHSGSAISYYIDAAVLHSVNGWLAIYPTVLNQMHLHTQSKPPGPVAWYMLWIQLLGYSRQSAVNGALALAVLQSFAVPATAWMIWQVTRNSAAAFWGAAFIALCPATSLIFPQVDSFYAVLTCLILIAADRFYCQPKASRGLYLGVVLGAATFCTYAVLTLGLLVIAFGIVRLTARGFAGHVVKLFLSAAIGFGFFYGTLWSFTSFDPWATFLAAWHNQHVLLAEHIADRPYPLTAIFDLTDFGLGMGWIGLFAVSSNFVKASNERPRDLERLAWLCIAMPLLLAVTGLMQSETFRVWNFLLPLMALCAGAAMQRWSEKERWVYCGGAFLVLVAVAANMTFVDISP